MFCQRKQLAYSQTYLFKKAVLNYRQMGQGKAVILVHGSVTNRGWNGFDKLLSRHYCVYALDLPGFGGSDAVSGYKHDTNLFNQALKKFIIIKKLKKAPIIGLSLGSLVVLKAAKSKKVCGKLILVGLPSKVLGISFRLANLLPLSIKRFVVSTTLGRQKIVLPILRQNTQTDRQTKNFNQTLFQAMYETDTKAIADPDYYRDIKTLPLQLGQIKNKTVLLYGENDPLKAEEAKGSAKIVIIPELGHNIFADDPKTSLKYISKLL
jgi:pimeloyl-ACP methyl ester carboxylesterase